MDIHTHVSHGNGKTLRENWDKKCGKNLQTIHELTDDPQQTHILQSTYKWQNDEWKIKLIRLVFFHLRGEPSEI